MGRLKVENLKVSDDVMFTYIPRTGRMGTLRARINSLLAKSVRRSHRM